MFSARRKYSISCERVAQRVYSAGSSGLGDRREQAQLQPVPERVREIEPCPSDPVERLLQPAHRLRAERRTGQRTPDRLVVRLPAIPAVGYEVQQLLLVNLVQLTLKHLKAGLLIVLVLR